MHQTHAYTRREKQSKEQRHDLTTPIVILAPQDRGSMPTAQRERCEHLLSERYSHGRRTLIRIGFEVYGRDGVRPLCFSRLPGTAVIADCPDPRQAKKLIEVVQRVLTSTHPDHRIDGKFFAVE